MRKLLLLLMILFALIALPVGAQNGTEIVSAAEVVADSPSEYSPSDGATDTDILTQPVFVGGSGMSLSYSLPEESLSSDQSLAYGDISEEKAINNLGSLSSSSGTESNASGTYNGAEAENTGKINNSGQISLEELNQTINVFDQTEIVFLAEADAAIGDQTPARQKLRRMSSSGRNANVSIGDQALISGQSEIMKIFEQYDVDYSGEGKNTFISGDSFSFAESQVQDDFIENGLMNELEQFRNGPVGPMDVGNQADASDAYSGSASTESENRGARDPYLDFLSNLELIKEFADGTNVTDQNVEGIFSEIDSQLDVLQNPGSKSTDDSTILPYLSPLKPSDIIRIEAPYLADFSFKDESDEPQNYAVVIGINQYSDRRNLRTSVNDAEEMARILRDLYGYEVIMLTDKTESRPPTKHNILAGALAELKAKQNRGDVLVYFSGHGEIDDSGNFYLVPQDADANSTSYISEDELNRYIKDIRGLSLIVDACYSGRLSNTESQRHYDGFQGVGEQEQLILSSSREDEPSNEMWNETNSVFTYYLCQAIKDEAKKSSRLPLQISLQSCFSSVQDKTARWSSSHFLSQTPILTLA